MNSSLYQTKLLDPFIFHYENSHAKSQLKANTAFSKFLIISNKAIGFLLKFYHGFSKYYHVFELRSLFTTFQSLKSVEVPMHVVVRSSDSKHFCSNASSCQIT